MSRKAKTSSLEGLVVVGQRAQGQVEDVLIHVIA